MLYARVFDIQAGREVSLGDDQPVLDAAIGSTGHYIARVEPGGQVRVFDVATSQQVASFMPAEENHSFNLDVMFSPDEKYLVSEISILTYEMWDLIERRQVTWEQENMLAVAFSPRYGYLATGTNHSANIYRISDHKPFLHLEHGAKVHSLAFSSDGRFLATGAGDNVARVFDLSSGTELSRVKHNCDVNGVDFSADGRYVATASDDGTSRVFQADSGREIARLGSGSSVARVRFSRTGYSVGAGWGSGQDGFGQVFQPDLGLEAARLERLGTRQEISNIVNVGFTPDGRRLMVGLEDDGVHVFETIGGRELKEYSAGGVWWATTSDGKCMAVAGFGGVVTVMEEPGGRIISSFVHPTGVTALALSADGQYLATLTRTGRARVFEVRSKKMLVDVAAPNELRESLLFSPDGHHILVRLDDGINVLNTATGKSTMHFGGATSPFTISRNGKYLAARAGDQIGAYSLQDGSALLKFPNGDWDSDLAFSLDGRELAIAHRRSSSSGKEIRVFEMPSGREIARQDCGGQIRAVFFDDNGRTVYCASEMEGNTLVVTQQWVLPEDLFCSDVFTPDPESHARRVAAVPWR